MKKLLVGVIILIVLVVTASLAGFIQFKPLGITSSQSAQTSLIQERVVELTELATLKYEYKNAMVNRDNKEIPLTDIRFAETIKLVEYTGYLKAGSDLSGVEVEYNKEGKEVKVRVPKAKVLDNVVNLKDMKIEDVKGNIFSDPPTQQIIDDIYDESKKFEEEKITQGFLTEADKRTEEFLKTFLNTDKENEVIVEFY
ncbi:hypothetical protein AC739_16215 [Planococcus glaciei]|uniref:DUF4230 domain-containing protein n=1 Tax=Planococcus glaciei TaxID=459472 RepID=UPI00069CF03E|nr:DUF4230 domain-containing protein [Planococcus glaciei]KOF09150.1 hypothetical protein AC739_16215 [Planococcus glaciei]